MNSQSLRPESSKSQRRPRFARGHDAPRAQLTERDLEMLTHLARHRFLRSVDMVKLVAGSEKKIIERLGQLYYCGFVDRPAAQGEYFRAGGGSAPITYALANAGAQVLIESNRMAPSRALTWARKNDHAKRPFIHHTLAVADFSIRLVTAAAARNHIGLLLGLDLAKTLPERTQVARSPFTWNVPVIFKGAATKIGIKPDLAFAIVYPDGSRRCYLLEADRGKMPIVRDRLEQTSILKKLIGYETGRKQELHKTQFGWKNFRVLIVTDTPTRADNILQTIASHDQLRQSPLFLVSDRSAIEAASDIFTHEWRTPNRRVTLLA